MLKYHKSTVTLIAHAFIAPIVGVVVSPAAAQSNDNPLDPNAEVLPMQYESLLSDFRAFDPDEEMIAWKEANDRVGEIGGWRAYLRNATKSKEKMSHSHGKSSTDMKHGNQAK